MLRIVFIFTVQISSIFLNCSFVFIFPVKPVHLHLKNEKCYVNEVLIYLIIDLLCWTGPVTGVNPLCGNTQPQSISFRVILMTMPRDPQSFFLSFWHVCLYLNELLLGNQEVVSCNVWNRAYLSSCVHVCGRQRAELMPTLWYLSPCCQWDGNSNHNNR